MRRTALRTACAALLTLAFAATDASAAGCRLALLFAMDVSSSVDEAEYRLQRDGLAAALLADEVRAALLDSAAGHVALAAYEWSGRYQQEMRLGWTMIRTEADILRAAETLTHAKRSHDDWPTAFGYALGYGANVIGRGPDCTRRVIDVSGDGVNNEGFAPALAYDAFEFRAIAVNGLAIEGDAEDIADYYRREIKRGPGAFVIVASGYDDFERAMTLKLLRELDDLLVGALPRPEVWR